MFFELSLEVCFVATWLKKCKFQTLVYSIFVAVSFTGISPCQCDMYKIWSASVAQSICKGRDFFYMLEKYAVELFDMDSRFNFSNNCLCDS